MPVAAVKQNLDDWVGPIKAEYHQLVTESSAVKPVTLQELEKMPGYRDMELAPSKLVTTVKSPNGKRKARIVICGNLVTKLTRMATRSKRLQCRQRTCTLEELTQQPFDAWSERPP